MARRERRSDVTYLGARSVSTIAEPKMVSTAWGHRVRAISGHVGKEKSPIVRFGH